MNGIGDYWDFEYRDSIAIVESIYSDTIVIVVILLR